MATYTFIPHWYTKQVRLTISGNMLLHFGLDRVFFKSFDKWSKLPKEIAEAEDLTTFKNRLRCHLANFSSEH